MSGWYQKIAKDISAIPDAIKHYEDELQQARYEIKIKGNVEKASADMPGIVEQRFNQLQEIEAILQYMNIELRRLRSNIQKIFRKLSKSTIPETLKNTLTVRMMLLIMKKINEFALLRNKWLGITKGLDPKTMANPNIVKLRVAEWKTSI